jgi:hypothetical protein
MATTDAPTIHQVVASFTTEVEGESVTYAAGELVHPDDPLLSKLPHHFRPVEFPHPVRPPKAKAATKAKADPAPESIAPETDPEPAAPEAVEAD